MSDAFPARRIGGGRIVLDTFRSAHDPMLGSWLLFQSQILADVEVVLSSPRSDGMSAASDQGVYGVWRVLATNNRELGRCASLHASPAEAFTDAERAKAASEELLPSVVRGAQPMTHAWVLRRARVPVLTASRWYESASEASAAAAAARKALGAATIVHGVSVGTQSGRRHRRPLVPAEPRD